MKTCKQKSINSANHFTGFCIIRTSIMKDLRSSSSTYLESLFLHVAKHNLLLFVCFFFYLAFLSQIFIIHRTAGEGRGYFLISFLPLPPAPQTLRYQLGYCCRELTSVHSWQPQLNMDPLVHALQNSLFLHLHWQLLLLGDCLKLRQLWGIFLMSY